MLTKRCGRGVTLVEFLIVLAIIAALLGLLMPAVMSAREKAREAVCKNNLHQLSLALAQFHESAKSLPKPPPAGQIGGWSVEVLPFLEQRPLAGQLAPGMSLSAIPAAARLRPGVMRCPVTLVAASNSTGVEAAHYVLATNSKRESWWLFDAPSGYQQPWPTGPELDFGVTKSRQGPHHGGFHISDSDGSVRLHFK